MNKRILLFTFLSFYVFNLSGQNKKLGQEWAEVEVGFWKNQSACCSQQTPIRKTKGWIKYLDFRAPNLFTQVSCLPE